MNELGEFIPCLHSLFSFHARLYWKQPRLLGSSHNHRPTAKTDEELLPTIEHLQHPIDDTYLKKDATCQSLFQFFSASNCGLTRFHTKSSKRHHSGTKVSRRC